MRSIAIKKFKAKGFDGFVADISDALPFDDQQFDLVYASEIIEHLADSESFLQEINRVLVVDGLVLLSTINSAFWPFRIVWGVQGPQNRKFPVEGLEFLC